MFGGSLLRPGVSFLLVGLADSLQRCDEIQRDLGVVNHCSLALEGIAV
jgi:hypothetical protein